jgi:hypothetical protein
MKNTLKNIWQRLTTWFAALPPIMAPSVEFPITAEVVENGAQDERELALLVVTMPPGLISWLVMSIPFGETITREEAAATLLQREIQVRYRPMIVEVDRIPSLER